MTSVECNENGFLVDATLLADAFGVAARSVVSLMKEGQITSRCESGAGEDVGTFRLTFFYGGRAYRFTVDANGSILKRASFDVPSRVTTSANSAQNEVSRPSG